MSPKSRPHDAPIIKSKENAFETTFLDSIMESLSPLHEMRRHRRALDYRIRVDLTK